jgi:hypothetical protein
VQRLESNDNLAQNQWGQASFASLTTFLQGTAKTFTVVPNPTELGWRSTMGTGYPEETLDSSGTGSDRPPDRADLVILRQ